MSEVPFRKPTSWVLKFRDSFRGVKLGVRGQSSFFVHFFFSAAVLVAALALRTSLVETCLLLGCITAVLTAEMFNSALEWLARAVDETENPHLGGALDIGSAAVLVASIGAAVIGAIVFLSRLAVLVGWSASAGD
jgi:diacylglycerol kinase